MPRRTFIAMTSALCAGAAASCARRVVAVEAALVQAAEPSSRVPPAPPPTPGESAKPSPAGGDAAGDASASAPEPWPRVEQVAEEASSGKSRSMCASELVQAAAEADQRLRTSGNCDKADLAVLARAVRALNECGGPLEPTRWIFPVAGVGWESVGGDGKGFVRSARLPCYATAHPGHPAHDIFVHDPRHHSRDREGREFLARAVEDGMVLVARTGWTPDDRGRGGNYVMLLLPARRLIAYYAHLETVLVKPGERVRAGQSIGTVGRTGKNAWPARSPTHLHFGLWDAATFVPMNSIELLKAAQRSAR